MVTSCPEEYVLVSETQKETKKFKEKIKNLKEENKKLMAERDELSRAVHWMQGELHKIRNAYGIISGSIWKLRRRGLVNSGKNIPNMRCGKIFKEVFGERHLLGSSAFGDEYTEPEIRETLISKFWNKSDGTLVIDIEEG